MLITWQYVSVLLKPSSGQTALYMEYHMVYIKLKLYIEDVPFIEIK
jgi:hypothetical protein